MRKISWIFTFIFISLTGNAQNACWIHPNKGQWDSSIKCKVDLNQGEILVGNDGYSFFLNDAKTKHTHNKKEQHSLDSLFKTQTIKKRFNHSNWSNEIVYNEPSSSYKNYYIGKDTSHWKSSVYSFQNSLFKNIYPGIDALLDGKNEQFQYTFIVHPNSDPNLLKAQIEGADSVEINTDGELIISHRFGTITETKPIAWTLKDGKKTIVSIEFELINAEV
jgi:hypothetical protein